MFYLVGTGLWRGDDISVRGAEVCKKANSVYLDGYTRAFEESELLRLEEIIGKKIVALERNELEEGLSFLKEAKEKEVVLLVPGDPLIATTHITILEEAKKRGIGFEVIHGSSIYDALIGEAGLHIYKVGGSCTIPMRKKGIKPYSVYEKLAENKSKGVHTLVFLDTEPGKEMDIREAFDILGEIESEKKMGICTDDNKIIVGCRVGSGEQRIIYGEIGRIKKMELRGPCALIFPGKLHFSEEEYLKGLEI